MNDEYIPPEPITDNHGLLVDRWLGAAIAQGMLDRGNIFLCHTVPEFREAWDGMNEDSVLGDYLAQHHPPARVQHGVNVIRAGLVLFGDSNITTEYIDMDARVGALRQSIRDVIDALNRGELTEAIIRETIDKRLS